MRFRFLGTGTSVGVPQIGCDCPTCTSADPRDRRRRCGAYVTAAGGRIAFLIDTPPELREACVAYGVRKVDAVVLTHAHMDHVAGFDDVRRFNTLNGTTVACAPTDPGANGRTCRVIGATMRCFAMPETIEAMHRIFPYVGTKPNALGLFRPMINFVADDRFDIGPVRVERLAVEHGFPCCGYLVEEKTGAGDDESRTGGRSLAYVSDCHALPDETVERARGVDTLVLNCLREREHPTHLNLSAALDYVGRIAPRRAYLIHMCHDLTHEDWLRKLPAGVEPAYDGLEIEI